MPTARYILVIVLALPAICRTQDLSPGLWQITVQTQAAMAPIQTSQCLTAADANDPSKLLGSVAAPDASGCSYSDKRYSGNTFHFAMECGGTLAIRATGDVTFSSSTLSGTIDISTVASRQPLEMKNSISAQRIGDCSTAR